MSERVLLCVDLSYQTYRAAAAHPMLTSRRVFTGGLYGFFATFGKMVRDTQATHVAFCRDVKPYKRSATYPQYKQLRKASADQELLDRMKSSLELVLQVLEDCGLKTWGIPGFESDDLIGHCAMKYMGRFSRIYAGSNDSDLYQLLWIDNFRIYRKGMHDLVSGKSLVKEMGVTPEQYMLMTALTGTHNDVEGIDRVGVKTARTIVTSPAILRSYRERYGDLIERNLALMKLPHPEFPRSAALPAHDHFSVRELYKALGYYDVDVTGAMASAFEQIRGEK